MSSDWLDLQTLARYLGRDARDLERLADRGRLPGQRVSGAWRFSRDEINQWIERELGTFSPRQLEEVEAGIQGGAPAEFDMTVTRLLSIETIAVPMDARTAPGVLQRLVELANATWHVYMPEKVLAAVKAREQMMCTALPGGVAIPHPRRPMPDAVGESLLAFARTTSGIFFGGDKGELTDLFFLVLCRDDRTHLKAIARLARIFQLPGFLETLRSQPDAASSLQTIRDAERSLHSE